MKEKLKKLIEEDKDLMELFTSLYTDMQTERIYREVQLSEKYLQARLHIPTKKQVLLLQNVLLEKEIIFSTEELTSFATEYGEKNFNWLRKICG